MLIGFFLFSCFVLLMISSLCGVDAFQSSPLSRPLLYPSRTFTRDSVNVPTRYLSSLAMKQNIDEDAFFQSVFNSWCQVHGRDKSDDERFEIFADNYRKTQDAFKGTAAFDLGPHVVCSWEEYVAIIGQDEDYLSQMTVKDLKEECRLLNLKVGGTKAVLVEKLQHGLRTIAKPGESFASIPSVVDETIVDDPVVFDPVVVEPVIDEPVVDEEVLVFDVSIPYDARAMLAYEASDKSMAYDDFKAKYEADAVAEVMAKYIDLSVPYDAAAKIAYETSDKSMIYDDFKAKYEADAVADVMTKSMVKQATPTTKPKPELATLDTSPQGSLQTKPPKIEQQSINTESQPQTSLLEDMGGFAGSILGGILENVKEMREQEMLEAEKRRLVREEAAIEESIKRKKELEESRARKENEAKEAQVAREKEQKVRRAEQEQRMRKVQETLEAQAIASAQQDSHSVTAEPNHFSPTPPSTPPPKAQSVVEKEDDENKGNQKSVGAVSGMPLNEVVNLLFGKKQ